MAGRVVGHGRVAVDGVTADEVGGVHHALGVGAQITAVEAEAAEHGRSRCSARRRVVDAGRAALPVEQRQHLARPVELHVAAGLGEASLEATAVLQHLRVHAAGGEPVPAHAVGLAEGQHGARGAAVVEPGPRHGEAHLVQAPLEQPHLGAAGALPGAGRHDGYPGGARDERALLRGGGVTDADLDAAGPAGLDPGLDAPPGAERGPAGATRPCPCAALRSERSALQRMA